MRVICLHIQSGNNLEPFSKKLKTSFIREAKDIVEEIGNNLTNLGDAEATETVLNRIRVLNGSVYCVGLKHLGLVGKNFQCLVEDIAQGLRPVDNEIKSLLTEINNWYASTLEKLSENLDSEINATPILEKLNVSGSYLSQQNKNKLANEKINVLLIDDEADITETLASTLSMHNFQVDQKNEPENINFEKLFVAGDTKYDVIVTDIKMPKMSGIEVVQAIRCFDSQVPILVMSGFGEVDSIVKLVNLGVQGFLHKPVPFDDFLEKVFTLAIRNKIYRSIQNIGESGLIMNMTIDKLMPSIEKLQEQNSNTLDLKDMTKGLENLRSMLQKIQAYH